MAKINVDSAIELRKGDSFDVWILSVAGKTENYIHIDVDDRGLVHITHTGDCDITKTEGE